MGEPYAECVGLKTVLYGEAGDEKWPHWMGHLPWDVRDAYARVLTDARRQFRFLHEELDRERAKLCELQGELDEAEWRSADIVDVEATIDAVRRAMPWVDRQTIRDVLFHARSAAQGVGSDGRHAGGKQETEPKMIEPITLFECDVCEWAATTGAPWKRCPHCDTVVPPTAREYVRLSDVRHALRRVQSAEVELVDPNTSPFRMPHGGACTCHESAGSFACEVHGDA